MMARVLPDQDLAFDALQPFKGGDAIDYILRSPPRVSYITFRFKAVRA